MDERAYRNGADGAEEPEDQENDRDCVQHDVFRVETSVGAGCPVLYTKLG